MFLRSRLWPRGHVEAQAGTLDSGVLPSSHACRRTIAVNRDARSRTWRWMQGSLCLWALTDRHFLMCCGKPQFTAFVRPQMHTIGCAWAGLVGLPGPPHQSQAAGRAL